MPQQTRQQITFGGAVNASQPSHLIGQDQVQTATNLDFSIERGAARPRRGYVTYTGQGLSHYRLWKSYSNGTVNGFLYSAAVTGNGTGSHVVGRAPTTGGSTGTWTQIASVSNAAVTNFVKYLNNVYIAGGTTLIKDDGTNTTEWIKQSPGAPTITINTSSGTAVIGTGSAVLPMECASYNVASSTSTFTGNTTTGRSVFLSTTGAPLNLGTIGGNPTGTMGVVYCTLGFSDPQNIYRVSIDFATDTCTVTATGTQTTTVTSGTTTSTYTSTLYGLTAGFNNYWHGEFLPNNGTSIIPAYPTVNNLTGAAQTAAGTAISQSQVTNIQSLINSDQNTPATQISFAANTPTTVGIPKTSFNYVGVYQGTGSDAWAAITGVRVTVESLDTNQVTYFVAMNIAGDTAHCLTDMNVGYTWWQTFAQIDSSGNFLGESPNSPSAGPYMCMNANATVVNTSTTTGTIAGVTHIITYRQGGYAQVPYAVATQSYGTHTFTDTTNDVTQLLSDTPMVINVQNAPNFGPWIVLATQHFYDRIYMSQANYIRWSQIGRPDQFVTTNTLRVSDASDPVQGGVVGPTGLVVVNWKSVYEFNGSVFEGPNADYVLQRANCRRGSIAAGVVINTPYGVPLLNYDGLTMYQPGAGVDTSIPWVVEQMGDAFRGFGNTDPAGLQGNRIPAINGALYQAYATYNEGKLYLTVPTGSVNTFNATTFVIDFNTEKVWWYQYFDMNGGGTNTATAQPITTIYWDFLNNQIYAGGTNAIYNLENNVYELSSGVSNANVPWNFTSRSFTVPNDTLVENLAVEFVGGPFTVNAIFDGTTTQSLGVCSNANRIWQTFPLSGIVTNNLVFQFISVNGTAFTPHTAVYQVSFDSIPEPERVHFYQTDYNDNSYPGDKLWDVLFADIAMLQAPDSGGTSVTGTVTAVTFVDGIAVMTNTITNTDTTGLGRRTYSFSFPVETYGEIAFTTYTSSQVFKMWEHRYACRNEPPRVTQWRTTIEQLDEAICDAYDVDINPNGTVLATAYVDNTATQTNTITGTKRENYTFKLPVETYGRTLYVLYNASSQPYFKHYNTIYHRRPEPDRWTNYVSDRKSGQEQHFDAHEVDVNPFNNTVLGTAFVDGTAYGTFTYAGANRQRFVNAFPAETYGKTVWTQFSVSSSGTDTALDPSVGRFKFFSDHFIGTVEPDRLTFVQKILPPWPSEQYLKTWVAQLNPLGTCVGTFMVDGAVLTTATFTGTIREMYNVGIDGPTSQALQTATAVEVRYSGVLGSVFKHYDTTIETEPKPFGKLTWAMSYKKAGGASQIDMARFWAIDVEIPPNQNVLMTSIWDIDGQPGFSTNTMTLTAQRTYLDRVPFPPGGRGRLFQQRLQFSLPSKVWRSSLDEEHIGIKGLARMTVNGTPGGSTPGA